MAWFDMHQSLARHRKTLRAVAILGVDRHKFIGHLATLWWWALDNVPETGELGSVTDGEIAAAAEWGRDSGRFVSALVEAGFIDQDEQGRRIHQWEEHGGKITLTRAANKERMKVKRALHVSRTDGARAEHVQRTDAARAPLEYSTVQDTKRTGQELPERVADVASLTRAKKTRTPKIPTGKVGLSEEETAELVLKYSAALGGAEEVRRCVALALSHTAATKYSNQKLYVDNWLRKDAGPRANGKGPATIPPLKKDFHAGKHGQLVQS